MLTWYCLLPHLTEGLYSAAVSVLPTPKNKLKKLAMLLLPYEVLTADT